MLKKFFITIMVLMVAASSVMANETLKKNVGAFVKAQKEKAPKISAQDLKKMMDAGEKFVLLDVRTAKEVAAVKINADDMPYYPRGVVEFYFTKKYTDTNAKIVVYCKAGARGALVTNRLKELGYKNVYNLTGGIKGWMKAGYPVENIMGLFKLVEE